MNRFNFLLMSMLLICLTISGCGKNIAVAGNGRSVLRIAGSTSMLPVSSKLARAYEQKHPGVVIHIEGGDSSLGVRGAANGIVEIGSVSRTLTKEESKALLSFNIARDSISIIVNEKNPVRQLTINDLRGVFSGKIKNWNQIGGMDSPITLISREQGSGTNSEFEDMVMDHKADIDGRALVMTSTGAVISTVAGDVSAIGYVSSGYCAKGVRTLEIHTGGDKVLELKRQLLYVIPRNAGNLARDYIDFCTGEEGQKIVNGQHEN